MRITFNSRHHAHDVQAILGSGFSPLRRCIYWLLRIDDPGRAQVWLHRVLQQGLVKSVADLEPDSESRRNSGGRHNDVVMLAVSYRGLMKLGLREHADFPFPSAFKGGMALRDEAQASAGAAGAWRWVDGPDSAGVSQCVHLLVAHYRDDSAAADPSILNEATMATHGLSVVFRVATCPSYIQPELDDGKPVWHAYEPFGFRDGIGQPVIKGLRLRAEFPDSVSPLALPPSGDHVVAAGEFVLGHTTEYGEPAYCPDIETAGSPSNAAEPQPAFGLNGSYLAVRQIRQRVADFREYEKACLAATADTPSIVEKMLGRRKGGTPLVPAPAGAAQIDTFRYRLDDQDGFQCPRGAHARRANPRDMLGWDTDSGVAAAKLHRILRRGRVYTEAAACEANGPHGCGDPYHRTDCGQGLFFMALNADLERQFEFVQQRWLGGASFADLCDETDLLAATPVPRSFSLQAVPVGRRLENLNHFTQDVGGGYFFVPGLAALRVMAGAAH